MASKAVVVPTRQVIYGDFRPQVSEVSSEWRPGKIPGNGNGGGGNGMDNNERIALVENNIHHIEKSLLSINTNIENISKKLEILPEINSSINSLKEKTDKTYKDVEDLIKWKHMIFGAAALIGFTGGVLAVYRFLN